MKIVFMGTPEFAVPTLERLFQSGHSISSVVTQPDRPKGRGQESQATPVKLFALANGLAVLQPAKVNTPEFVEILRQQAPDVIVVVAFGQILSAKVLAIPRIFCVNLHASLLPKYRGAAPINWAIMNGEMETGVTTMKMDVGMDTGDMLLAQKISIKETDTAQTLHDTLCREGAGLVLETLRRLEQQSLVPIPQDNLQASYAPKLKKEDGLIRWDKRAAEIRNHVRGLEPWPGVYAFYKSKRLKICKVEASSGETQGKPGEILRLSDYGIEVGTGDGRIIITELQPEGKKRMSAMNFLHGNAMNKGEYFDDLPQGAAST
jgi:methionyl-tRNA formyltransferase